MKLMGQNQIDGVLSQKLQYQVVGIPEKLCQLSDFVLLGWVKKRKEP